MQSHLIEIPAAHKTAVVVDVHTHPFLNIRLYGKNPMHRHKPPMFWNPIRNHIDIPRAFEGGVDGFGIVCYPLHSIFREPGYFRILQEDLEIFHRVIAENPDLLMWARHPDDFRAAKSHGKIALFPAVEGAHALDGDIGNLDYLREKGVWYLTLAHFLCNLFANASSDPNPPFPGLSRMGRELVRRLNELDIVADVAHLSEAGFWEVMEISQKPVFSSHSGVRALCDISRNLSDSQIKAIAERGGVIGICFWPPYLKKNRFMGELDWVVEAILHVMQVGGERAACIGSDMDGYIWLPRGIKDVTGLPVLTQKLQQRGLTEQQIHNVLGGNFMNMMEVTFGKKEARKEA